MMVLETFCSSLLSAWLIGWLLFLAGLAYALVIPVGSASVWILLPTVLLGLVLVVHFASAVFRPLPKDAGQQ